MRIGKAASVKKRAAGCRHGPLRAATSAMASTGHERTRDGRHKPKARIPTASPSARRYTIEFM